MATLVPGQSAVSASPASDPLLIGTLPAAATAGNIIWYGIGGDKDIGTLSITDNVGTNGGLHPWSIPVNLRSTSTSLVLAWKVAVGGETAVTGTISTPTANGSSVYVGEYEETGTGAWEIKASATNNTNETNVLVWPSGTTGATSGAGRAIAAFSVDSISTEGTTSYTNGYVERANPSDTPVSGGTGGLWVAENDIAAGVTTSTTITRAGGAAADQMSGAVVVFGRAPAAPGGGDVARTRAFLGLL